MMNSSLRTKIAAAAMLLAPMGAMLVAAPASAQHRYVVAQAVAPQPVIERFVVRGSGKGQFDPGRELRFRLEGAAGGQATLDIPGLLRAAPMTETRPGVYEATYVIRRQDDPRAFERATATLAAFGQRVAARVELPNGRDIGSRRDDRAPVITDITPVQGERVGDRGRTRIAAHVGDEGSGVDTVLLRVDGRDVTGRARIEGGDVRYAEDLRPGRHSAELVVRDRAGNVARRSWSFDVVDRDRGDGRYGYHWQPQR